MLYPAVISPNQIIPNGRDIFSLSRLPCLSHLIVWLELERWPREETSLRFRIQTSLDMGGKCACQYVEGVGKKICRIVWRLLKLTLFTNV